MADEVGLSDSRMAMWRSLVAFAYVDGALAEQEKKLLLDCIEKNRLSAAQRSQLESDINNSIKLKDVYPGITELKDRGDLLTLAQMLLCSGGNFDAARQRVYDEIHNDQEHAVDFDKADKVARINIEEYKLNESFQTQQEEQGMLQKYDNPRLPIMGFIQWISDIPDFFS